MEYNRELLKEFRVDAKERMNETKLSVNSLNPLILMDSTNRGVMASGHMAQMLVLNSGEEKIVQSGVDHQFGKYTFGVRIKEDCKFLGMVERYKSFDKEDKTIEVLIFVENISDGTFDYYSIPYYFSLHQYFGFQYVYKFKLEELRNMKVGTLLEEGLVLADSPTVQENDGYAFGLNANILLGTMYGQEEDGVIISQSLAEKLSYSVFEKRVIEFGSDKFLLNLYGKDGEYQGFPNIGEMVSSDGRLAALRTYNPDMVPSMMSKEDLKRANPEFDKCVYVEPGSMVKIGDKYVPSGVVVDIKAYFNHKNKGKNNVIPETLGSSQEMVDKLRTFYGRILDIYTDEMLSRKNTRGSISNNFRKDGTIKLSPALSSLIEDAYVISNRDGKKIAYVNRSMTLDVYYLEFTIQYQCTALLGSKITDLNGGKGVIVKILPDERMPYDANGVRADVIMDPTSIISRSNLGRLYEIYFNSASREAKRQITEVLKKDPNDINGAWKLVLEFLSIFDNEQYRGYKQCNDEDKRIVLDDIVNKEFFILYRLGAEKPAYEIVLELKKSRFAPLKDKIFIPGKDKVHVTNSNISIGTLYTILLGKTAGDALSSACDSFLNHYGFPSRPSASNKYNFPWKIATIKFMSETDTRLIAACCGTYGLILLKDRANSQTTNMNIHKNILKADKPGGMKCAVNREEAPLGNDSAIILLNSILRPMGMSMRYIEDKKSNLIPESNPRVGFKKTTK